MEPASGFEPPAYSLWIRIGQFLQCAVFQMVPPCSCHNNDLRAFRGIDRFEGIDGFKKPFAHILQMSLKHELNQFHCNSDHEISFSQKDRSPSLGIPRYFCSGHCLSHGGRLLMSPVPQPRGDFPCNSRKECPVLLNTSEMLKKISQTDSR